MFAFPFVPVSSEPDNFDFRAKLAIERAFELDDPGLHLFHLIQRNGDSNGAEVPDAEAAVGLQPLDGSGHRGRVQKTVPHPGRAVSFLFHRSLHALDPGDYRPARKAPGVTPASLPKQVVKWL